MKHSEETDLLLKAIIEAAPKIHTIAKSKQAYGYKYATLDSLIDMLRGVLPGVGLWFVQMPTRIDGKSFLTTRVFHTSGQWIEDSIEMTDTELQGKANDTQRIGASITYYRRYVLSAIFGVSSDEDLDGNIENAQPQPKQPQKQQPKPAKKKEDPFEYITHNFNTRKGEGEPEEAIITDYGDIVGRSFSSISELNDEEKLYLARALYSRYHKNFAQGKEKDNAGK